MSHAVVAPDKFRGTASAVAVAAAGAAAARSCGWSADEVPLADGGEGTLEAIQRAHDGELHRTRVSGPLGQPVDAGWLVLRDTSGLALPPPLVRGEPTAFLEAAAAAGRALLADPRDDEPLFAASAGVGQLVLAAVEDGARQVVVAVGGTATTDGGTGARTVLDAAGGVGDTRLVVAYDVATRFLDAARVFAPQKGATPAQVDVLSRRLEAVAARIDAHDGVDVTELDGGGAGGGLAGGLAPLAAALVPGFTLVADLVGLEHRLEAADLVVTGEGRLDATSFGGKVVGGVLAACGGRPPALCVVGEADVGLSSWWAGRRGPVEVVTLAETVGPHRAWNDTAGSVAVIVAARCVQPAGHVPL